MRKLLLTALVSVAFCQTALAERTPLTDSGSQPASSTGMMSRISDQAHAMGDHAADVVMSALAKIDIPYKLGGNSAETGFDCSGFVRATYKQTLGLMLPRRAAEQAAATQKIKREDLRPGDLVFFNTMRRSFSHVGIYIGDNKFVHAPRTGAQVRVEKMDVKYWSSRFDGARRVSAPEGLGASSEGLHVASLDNVSSADALGSYSALLAKGQSEGNRLRASTGDWPTTTPMNNELTSDKSGNGSATVAAARQQATALDTHSEQASTRPSRQAKAADKSSEAARASDKVTKTDKSVKTAKAGKADKTAVTRQAKQGKQAESKTAKGPSSKRQATAKSDKAGTKADKTAKRPANKGVKTAQDGSSKKRNG